MDGEQTKGVADIQPSIGHKTPPAATCPKCGAPGVALPLDVGIDARALRRMSGGDFVHAVHGACSSAECGVRLSMRAVLKVTVDVQLQDVKVLEPPPGVIPKPPTPDPKS